MPLSSYNFYNEAERFIRQQEALKGGKQKKLLEGLYGEGLERMYATELGRRGQTLSEKSQAESMALSERAQAFTESSSAENLALRREEIAKQNRQAQMSTLAGIPTNLAMIEMVTRGKEGQPGWVGKGYDYITGKPTATPVSSMTPAVTTPQSVPVYNEYGQIVGYGSSAGGGVTAAAPTAYQSSQMALSGYELGGASAMAGYSGAAWGAGSQAAALTGSESAMIMGGGAGGTGGAVVAAPTVSGGAAASGLGMMGYAAPAAAGYVAGTSGPLRSETEHLGSGFGIIKDEGTKSALGGGIRGAGAGAIVGTMVMPGVGTIVGTVVGAVFGAIGGYVSGGKS